MVTISYNPVVGITAALLEVYSNLYNVKDK